MGQLARQAARTPPCEENSPSEYIDRSLTILGRTFEMHDQRMVSEVHAQRDIITTQFLRLGGRFPEMENKINGRFAELEQKMDRRFEEVDGRFDKLENNMNLRFKEVDERFDKLERNIDRRFKEVDDKMRQRFDHAQKASRNFLRTRGWEDIYPVGSIDAQGGIHTPQNFPRTVRSFWRLRNPSNRNRLTDLLRFYQTQGYQEWGQDTDDDPDDSSETTLSRSWKKSPSPTLEDAVHSNPHIAHRALGAHLGLSYDEIQKFMDRAQELGQAQASGRNVKRSYYEPLANERNRRPPFKFEASPTEVTSPSDPLPSQERTS
ncbi:MAG: hypothetical protein Q9225_004320 [Loekoesia sp. 1 TL-2023]